MPHHADHDETAAEQIDAPAAPLEPSDDQARDATRQVNVASDWRERRRQRHRDLWILRITWAVILLIGLTFWIVMILYLKDLV